MRKLANGRVLIADDVAAAIGGPGEAIVCDLREHKQFECLVCNRPVMPESSDPVSVIVARNPATKKSVLRLVHADHGKSSIVNSSEAAVTLGVALLRAVMVTQGTAPMLLTEDDVVEWHLNENYEEQRLASFLEGGFAGHPSSADAKMLPAFNPNWELEMRGDDLALRGPNGIHEHYPGALAASGSWRSTVQRAGSCLVIAGSAMGLSGGLSERVNTAVRANAAVSGVIRMVQR